MARKTDKDYFELVVEIVDQVLDGQEDEETVEVLEALNTWAKAKIDRSIASTEKRKAYEARPDVIAKREAKKAATAQASAEKQKQILALVGKDWQSAAEIAEANPGTFTVAEIRIALSKAFKAGLVAQSDALRDGANGRPSATKVYRAK